MRVKVTTETGSYYHIDFEAKYWIKNGGTSSGSLRRFSVGRYEDRMTALTSMEFPSSWHEASFPRIGKSMYIGSGLHEYWLTTEVVDIVLNPEDWPN